MAATTVTKEKQNKTETKDGFDPSMSNYPGMQRVKGFDGANRAESC